MTAPSALLVGWRSPTAGTRGMQGPRCRVGGRSHERALALLRVDALGPLVGAGVPAGGRHGAPQRLPDVLLPVAEPAMSASDFYDILHEGVRLTLPRVTSILKVIDKSAPM